jgi:hypothetical protein
MALGRLIKTTFAFCSYSFFFYWLALPSSGRGGGGAPLVDMNLSKIFIAAAFCLFSSTGTLSWPAICQDASAKDLHAKYLQF